MPETAAIPNVSLIAWREEQGQAGWTRAEMAEALNRTKTGLKDGLTCDEERIRRWERGEVLCGRTRRTGRRCGS